MSQIEEAFYVNGRRVLFTSKFDNGNLASVVMQSSEKILFLLTPGLENHGTDHEGTASNWFYFSVSGLLNAATFCVRNLQILWSLLRFKHNYRPAVKVDDQSWDLLAHPIDSLALGSNDKVEMTFTYQFKNTATHYFAFKCPWSYQDNQSFLSQIQQHSKTIPGIYFRKELLVRSPNQKKLHLLTVTAAGQSPQKQQSLQGLFPEGSQRPLKFKKPVILMTSRVHPVEVPSSHCMNGIINFLLEQNDPRAEALRKLFVFMLVPMLNPDGVSFGNSRMDTFNQNLNRHYKSPDPKYQPSCFAIKRLVQHLNQERRLFFFCDLHAHPANKGNFIFANAIENFVLQTESVTFLKVLARNSPHFQFQNCIYSKKHMKARDYGEDLSKEGCARVVVYECSNIVHSYTLECGYHVYSSLNPVALLPKHSTPLEEEQLGPGEVRFFTPDIYANLGRNLLVSILDVWQRNSWSRIQSLQQQRREIAHLLKRLERFRRHEDKLNLKVKNIGGLISECYYSNWKNQPSLRKSNFAIKTLKSKLVPRVRPPSSRKEEPQEQSAKELLLFQPPVLDMNLQADSKRLITLSRSRHNTFCPKAK